MTEDRLKTKCAAWVAASAALVVLAVAPGWLPVWAAAQEVLPPGSPAPAVTTGGLRWQHSLSLALDSFIHTYPLATQDTTETVNELNFGYVVVGRSARQVRHRWNLRANLLAGTQLYRQRIETQYAWLPDARQERVRVDVDLFGRQYNRSTDYNLSSDNLEARGEIRAVPILARLWATEVRLGADWIDFRTPSNLEQNYSETEAAVFVRAPTTAATRWSVGLRNSARAYPDTAAIDRDVVAVEGDLALFTSASASLRAFHRSSHRDIADDTVRPSAWLHWSELRAEIPAGRGEVIVEAESEIWNYGYETDVYFDSRRGRGYVGYRLGDLLAAAWQFGLAGERFDAGTQPETYDQAGLRVGLESYGGRISGGLIVEYGRRSYRAQEEPGIPDEIDSVDDLGDVVFAYTDFNYWEIWLMATWRFSVRFSLEALANYRPESHTEPTDDAALGFGSLRLVWRP